MIESPADLPPLEQEDPQAQIERLEVTIRETFPDLLTGGRNPIDVAIATFVGLHTLNGATVGD